MPAKILLINLPAVEGSYNYAFPTGLACIASALIADEHDVHIWDVNICGQTRSAVIDYINNIDEYDIVGIGGLITTYRYLSWFAPLLRKKLRSAKIIIGGGVASEASDLILKNGFADYTVIGEGDVTVRQLVSAILNHESPDGVKGIAYLDGEAVVRTDVRPLVTDLDSIEAPAYQRFDIEAYLRLSRGYRGKSIATLITSRGCPFNCNFCYHIFGRGYRSQSVDRIISDLEYLNANYGPDMFSFSDELFVAKKERVFEFCEKYRKTGISKPWICKSRVDTVDAEMFKVMKGAGCEAIGYGFESGSQLILDRMNKHTTVDQMARAVMVTRKAGMYCGASFMIGYPGETLDTIDETVKFCRKHALSIDGLYYTTPYPGTQLYGETESVIFERYGDKESFISALGDTRTFTVNLTDFEDDRLVSLRNDALRQINRRSLKKYYNQVRHRGVLDVLSKVGGRLRRRMS